MLKTGKKNKIKRKSVEQNPSSQKCNSCSTVFVGKNLSSMINNGKCAKCRNDQSQLDKIPTKNIIQCPICNTCFIFELGIYIKNYFLPYEVKDNCIIDDNYLKACKFQGKRICKKCRTKMDSQLKTKEKSPVQRPAKQISLGCSDRVEDWWS